MGGGGMQVGISWFQSPFLLLQILGWMTPKEAALQGLNLNLPHTIYITVSYLNFPMLRWGKFKYDTVKWYFLAFINQN